MLKMSSWNDCEPKDRPVMVNWKGAVAMGKFNTRKRNEVWVVALKRIISPGTLLPFEWSNIGSVSEAKNPAG
jgi:hypothetical protein